MLNGNALRQTVIYGTAAQLIMVFLGHFNAFVALHVFAFGGMLISAATGFFYARLSRAGYGGAALGGAIVGGISALIGIAASVAMHDTLPIIVVFGTVSSAVTGAVGGLLARVVGAAA